MGLKLMTTYSNEFAGIVGTNTPLKTSLGTPLKIGDVVTIKTINGTSKSIVCATSGYSRPFIMGIASLCQTDDYLVKYDVELVISYQSIKDQEIYDSVRVVHYNYNVIEEAKVSEDINPLLGQEKDELYASDLTNNELLSELSARLSNCSTLHGFSSIEMLSELRKRSDTKVIHTYGKDSDEQIFTIIVNK
jgi:hypothetical protein